MGNQPNPAIQAIRSRAGRAASSIIATCESRPASRPSTMSAELTRVVSSRPIEPRSLSPARLPARTAGDRISAAATIIPSMMSSAVRSSLKGW